MNEMYDFDLYHKKLKKMLSEKRYLHSVNVASAALELAEIYGEDKEKACIAGLLHDIAKEMSTKKHLKILRGSGAFFEDFKEVSPKVLHGPAGSVYIKKNFNITDEDILNAIWYHTTGREDMRLFEKIIFVADYISSERNFLDSAEVREIAKIDLDKAALHKLSTTIKKCVILKQAIHLNTVEAYNQLVYAKN